MGHKKRKVNRQMRPSVPVQQPEQETAQQISIPVAETPVPIPNVEQRIEMIPLANIVTEGYQRVLNMINVKKIARDFDIAKVGVLVVNKRANGTYAVLDGQHRLTAMRKIGIEAANCIVLEGLTVKEEADYFRRQNENKQSLRVADTFNAALWAEDPDSLRIKEIAYRYGFRFGKSGNPMCISAIAALQKIVQLYGFETLEYVLASISVTWPNDAVILRREMLAGLGEFWWRFAGQLTLQQFAYRLKQKLPMDMYIDARNRSQGKLSTCTAFNKDARFTTCSVLMDAYNKGLRKDSNNRISMEWNNKESE